MRHPNVYIRPNHTELRVTGRGLEEDQVEYLLPNKIIVEILTGLEECPKAHIVELSDLIDTWKQAQ